MVRQHRARFPAELSFNKQPGQTWILKLQIQPSQMSAPYQRLGGHCWPPQQQHTPSSSERSGYAFNAGQVETSSFGTHTSSTTPNLQNRNSNGQPGISKPEGCNNGGSPSAGWLINSGSPENGIPSSSSATTLASSAPPQKPPETKERYSNPYTTPVFTDITDHLDSRIKNFHQFNIIPFNFLSRTTTTVTSAGFFGGNSGNVSYWKWNDPAYVRLPHSPYFKVGTRSTKAWDDIVDQLMRLKEACKNRNERLDVLMACAVCSYCPAAAYSNNFAMLNHKDLTDDLGTCIPHIVDWALKLPTLLRGPIPNLYCGDNKTIFLTRRLCCSLLANAFFCTFPPPSTWQQQNMPIFNFLRLYSDTGFERCEVKKEKIKCLLKYFLSFSKMDERRQNEIVSFERKYVRQKISWEQSPQKLVEVTVKETEKIEEADGFLQCDFANKVIGGGVLNEGAVMEEIRFCISPELIVSRLFMEAMNDEEAIIITGSQIYSKYSGYGMSFKWAGFYEERMPSEVDNLGRTRTQVVAMDALHFTQLNAHTQFQRNNIDRELHKCYVAFFHGKHHVSPVATGNWGCGVFNGNPELKFLIQWMAASQQDRKRIQYHTMGDQQQSIAIRAMNDLLKRNANRSVGDLYKIVTQYNPYHESGTVFQFIENVLNRRRGGDVRESRGTQYSDIGNSRGGFARGATISSSGGTFHRGGSSNRGGNSGPSSIRGGHRPSRR